MRIESTRQGDVVILRPRGLLAGTDAEELKASLAKAMDETPAQIVLDASGILFADSRGLEVLVEAAERMIQRGLTLKLAGANAILREVLELTELAPLFEHCQNVDAAVGSCQ